MCASNTKYDAGEEFATRVDDAYTRSAMGIRVPAAVGDFLILRAVRESGGFCIAVDDDAIDAVRSFRVNIVSLISKITGSCDGMMTEKLIFRAWHRR